MNAESEHEPPAAVRLCSCGEPALPHNPFCAACDLRVLIVAREMFPDAADADFEREVPRG